MKKVLFLISLSVLLVGFLTFSITGSDGPNPDTQLAQVQAAHDQFSTDAGSAITDYVPDYHPYYGVIGIDDMPVHSEGWQDSYVSELFPGETIEDFYVEQITISGRILMKHLDQLGNEFFVWHDVQDEPVNHVMVRLIQSPFYYGQLVGPRCGNAIAVYVDGMFRGWIRDGRFSMI